MEKKKKKRLFDLLLHNFKISFFIRRRKILKKLIKIKIFKFLINFKNKNILADIKKANKFRNFFLKFNFFENLLRRHSLILYRENKIVDRLTKMYKLKRRRLINKYINLWKKFYICEKFRKVKKLRKLAKIFYAMKIILNKL